MLHSTPGNTGAKTDASALIATLLFAMLAALLTPADALAETAYISDRLTVPLRSGPSNANRILHRGLPSGTRMEILARDSDSGFVQIRTDRGTEGWLPAQYLVSEPIARDQLAAANRRIETLNQTISQQRQRLDELSSGKSASDQTVGQLNNRVKELEHELSEIKRISAGAIAQNETNKELTALNERLRSEVDELVATITALEDNLQERWLLIGGGLVIAGLILGVAIKARPRRSAWT